MASDLQVTNAIRCLAVDIVQKANSGHPGAPMGMAPISSLLWSEVLKFNPAAPDWHNRDRFVLSNGHASALIYTMLHMTGYALTIEDLQQFRQLNSKTPGHPERFVTPGVEVTTGPLGQGIANATGMAIAEAHLAAVFNRPGFDVVDHHTVAFLGDGCLMEGVCQEATSLAGHLGLGKLIAVYDDNKVTIDGSTEIAFTENTKMKFEALGWHTIVVENGDADFAAMRAALHTAKQSKHGDKPTIILLRTTIGYGAKLQGTSKVHGSPLGPDEIRRVKESVFGRDPEKSFFVEPEVYAHFAAAAKRGADAQEAWQTMFKAYEAAHPDLAQQYAQYHSGKIDPSIWQHLPLSEVSKSIATRKASEAALSAVLTHVPNVIGGSADLSASNLTRPAVALKLGDFQKNCPSGRTINFGVREHGMAAVMNGIDAHGGLITFGATFLNFVGYALGAVRLSALAEHGVIWVGTHDSIGLGSDGPTHQPIELLASLRATPNLFLMRPADQTETSAAWCVALEHRRTPSIMCLSRQSLLPLSKSSLEGLRKGAYLIYGEDKADVTLIGTGSEVGLCLAAAARLEKESLSVRVISMPCAALFDQQPSSYRNALLPCGTVTVSVECYSGYGWDRYSHCHIGMTTFGASAADADLFKHFGFTEEAVAKKTMSVYQYFKKNGVTPQSRLWIGNL